MEGSHDPRFRLNTAPGIMKGVNEAHGSYLQRPLAIELRDELDAWIKANPTPEEIHQEQLAEAWDEGWNAGNFDCIELLGNTDYQPQRNPYRSDDDQ